MDTLKEYLSSDESNETLQKLNIDQHDYFGLNKITDDDDEVAKEEEKILLNLRLQAETSILHRSVYGPDIEVPEEQIEKPRDVIKSIKKSKYLEYNSNIKIPRLLEENINNEAPLQKRHKSEENINHDTITSGNFLFNNQCFKIQSVNEKLPSFTIGKINAHTQCISKLSWSLPNSHLLLSSSLDCSVKIWNLLTRKCEKEFNNHVKGVKSAVWTLCGKKIFSGGYDNKAYLLDVVTGKELNIYFHSSYVTCVQVYPQNENILLTGSKNSIRVFDIRTNSERCIKKTSLNFGQVLDLAFLLSGKEIICSTDLVSKDSADRTIMAWDFETSALLSNQIYQERYTCPSLKVHPSGSNFIAQTNGNYIALFSSIRPYKMNKNKRYEGHKVCGYNIHCDFSPDGNFILSGDAEGAAYIYKTDNARLLRKLNCTNNVPVVSVCWHPELLNTLAIGTWNGQLQFWK